MSEKPKVAFYWCGTCGGCEEAVVDLAEKILDVVAAVDIVFWPVAMDFKKDDVEAMSDGSIAVSFINGAMRNSEDIEMVKLLRRKSGLVVAFGSCSHLGGIPGLINFSNTREVMETVYFNAPSVDNPDKILPKTSYHINGYELELPTILNTVKRMDEIIEVDYYLPGCAPPPALIAAAVNAILTNALPPRGSILSPNRNMCETCPLEQKDEKIKITEFKRLDTFIPEPNRCLLEQGVLCMGPVTRAGCGELCMRVGIPCRGCFGPTDPVEDIGLKFISALGSVIEANNEEEIKKIIDTIPNFSHVLYMFNLPSSVLQRKIVEEKI